MADPNIELSRKETYLKMIENSVGSRLFNSIVVLYKDTGNIEDASKGEHSCAFFSSGVLLLAGMLPRISTTVPFLQKQIEESDEWKAVEDIQEGDVLFWEEMTFPDRHENGHSGFVIGDDEAVSTSSENKEVVRHHITYGVDESGAPKRKIMKTFRYKF